jgi:hypothetical protein
MNALRVGFVALVLEQKNDSQRRMPSSARDVVD